MTKLIHAAITALGSLASFAAGPQAIRNPYQTPWDALQSDWSRIGQDMTAVIERENAKIKKTKSGSRSEA